MSSKKKVAIVDYKLGNLFSVKQACVFLGMEAEITTDKDLLSKADFLILPGVGAFGEAMHNLNSLDLVSPIHDYIASGRPFMGVCLGLQLLFSESEEFGSTRGLNLIPGVIKKFKTSDLDGNVLKVPQIEWNKIYETGANKWKDSPLVSCKSGDYMYFVHSYYVQPESGDSILSNTTYGGFSYCSSIINENIFACQFHPEKSGLHGVEIYKNWFSKQYINASSESAT